MPYNPDPASARWHLSKRIDPIQLIVLVGMLFGGVWFLAQQDKRLTTIEEIVVEHDEEIETLKTGGGDTREELARMTALLESIDSRLARQERRLDNPR